MNNTTSRILVIRAPPGSVAGNTANAELESQCAPILPYGPGRTLHEMYLSLGSVAETSANRVAHRLGLGPLAVAARITAYFARHGHDTLDNGPLRRPQKDCSRLMEYALPSESCGTQTDAFKSIINLTTRYPCLRSLFLKCRYVRHIQISEHNLASLWDRVPASHGQEWGFFRNFAAACIADIDISGILVESRQSPTCIDGFREGLSVVERLLVAADCQGPSDFSKFLAIRYLGGILELSSFWLQTGPLHEAVLGKIFAKSALFLRDIGVDSLEDGGATRPSDVEGIDQLCKALLRGMQNYWMVGTDSTGLKNKCWFESLIQVIYLLRHPNAEDLLPNSWAYATSAEMKRWIPTPHRIRVFSTLVSPETCKPGTGAIPSFIPGIPGTPRNSQNPLRTFFQDMGPKRVPLPENIDIHRSSASSEHLIPEYPSAPMTNGSGVTEVLPSQKTGDTTRTAPCSAKTTGSKRWWRLRAFYRNLGSPKLRKDTHLHSRSDPAALAAQNLPSPTGSGGSSIPDAEVNPEVDEIEDLEPPANSSTFSAHIGSPTVDTEKPVNPLGLFNERTQKSNQSVGWVYSALPASKNGSAALGEPLRMWSVEVLIDGEVFGRGTGSTRKAGRRAAAQQALAMMDDQSTTQRGESASSSLPEPGLADVC
ncbi:hypothetical protein C8R44DRAFT_783467 [Mycena epipterygia]|nr:hypothetical protein C8R44DRAFT_783467 [Mycena epipterygia]